MVADWVKAHLFGFVPFPNGNTMQYFVYCQFTFNDIGYIIILSLKTDII